MTDTYSYSTECRIQEKMLFDTEFRIQEKILFILWCRDNGLPVTEQGDGFSDPAVQAFWLKTLASKAELWQAKSYTKEHISKAMADYLAKEVLPGKDPVDLLSETGMLECFMILATEIFSKHATNYVEFHAERDGKEYILNISHADGESPHQLRLKAEAERDLAQRQLQQLTSP